LRYITWIENNIAAINPLRSDIQVSRSIPMDHKCVVDLVVRAILKMKHCSRFVSNVVLTFVWTVTRRFAEFVTCILGKYYTP
jgi:hypothetical protein